MLRPQVRLGPSKRPHCPAQGVVDQTSALQVDVPVIGRRQSLWLQGCYGVGDLPTG